MIDDIKENAKNIKYKEYKNRLDRNIVKTNRKKTLFKRKSTFYSKIKKIIPTLSVLATAGVLIAKNKPYTLGEILFL